MADPVEPGSAEASARGAAAADGGGFRAPARNYRYSGEELEEGARIRRIALEMAATDKQPLSRASPSQEHQRAAIDRLFGYLDLVDRKGNSLITINSFLVAVAGILVFKPLGSTSGALAAVPPDAGDLAILLGAAAIGLSGWNVTAALRIFHLRWRFMEACRYTDESCDFGAELTNLANEAALRQRIVGELRARTLFACAIVAGAILASFIWMIF